MKRIKKIANKDDIKVFVTPPFSPKVLNERNDNDIPIQLNRCSNPFCSNYGKPQKKLLD